MAEFVLKIADSRGQIRQQTTTASSEKEARERYASQGFLVYSIRTRESKIAAGFGRKKKLNLDKFLIFNQQFVTLGNLEENNRISLFVIDYPTRTRLKIYGRAHVIEADEDPELLQQLLQVPGGTMTAKAQRSIVVEVEAFDWNCSRNITPRFDKERMDESLALARQPLQAEVDRLTAEVEELRARLSKNE